MSRRQHDRQLERARGRRREAALERRQRRSRVVVIVMVVLLVLSVGGAALFSGRDEPQPEVTDEPGGEDEGPEGGEGSDEQAAEQAQAERVAELTNDAAPCPEPDDAPEVDAEIYDEPFEPSDDVDELERLTLETTCGEVVIELDTEGAPVATTNVVELAEDGYYDGVGFHRVVAGFVVQAGDPAGTGCGRDDCTRVAAPDEEAFPGFAFDDELETAEGFDENEQGGVDYPRGTVAMANSGPDTNGSQFFVAQGDPTPLPGPDYTVLGEVVEGMDVIDSIAAGPVALGSETPEQPVLIRSITVEGS